MEPSIKQDQSKYHYYLPSIYTSVQTLLLKTSALTVSHKYRLIGLVSADPPTPPTAVATFKTFFRAIQWESTKHGPSPWTGSIDRVYQNMDRVHGPLSWTGSIYIDGPPIMDRVHRPPIFTSPNITEVNKNKISKLKTKTNSQ